MDNRTQMLGGDPNRTQLGVPPQAGGADFDPNRTIIGSVARENLTVTVAPQQCPVCRTFNPAGLIYCNACGLIFGTALEGDAFGAPAVQLPKLVEGSGREHAVREGETIVGREGDVALASTGVSRRHAKLTKSGDSVTLEDLGSTNGTKRDGVPLAAGERVALSGGETISFGGVELRYELPGGKGGQATQQFGGNKTAAISAPPSAKPFARLVGEGVDIPLKLGVNTFGRRAGNDAVVPDPYISGKHGEIEVTESEVYVRDTGSTNGTVVGGAKLPADQRTKLEPGEEIVLGSLRLRVER